MAEVLDIIVADSQYLVRVGLREVLDAEAGLNVVAEVRNEQELLTQISKKNPHLIIIDYDQPDFFSVGTIEKIADKHPQTEMIVISS
ncbi:MAG: response regulator, partial [Bacteroidota bacterium]